MRWLGSCGKGGFHLPPCLLLWVFMGRREMPHTTMLCWEIAGFGIASSCQSLPFPFSLRESRSVSSVLMFQMASYKALRFVRAFIVAHLLSSQSIRYLCSTIPSCEGLRVDTQLYDSWLCLEWILFLAPLPREARAQSEEGAWGLTGCRTVGLGQGFYSSAFEALSFGVLQDSRRGFGQEFEVQRRDSSQVVEEDKKAQEHLYWFLHLRSEEKGKREFPSA